MSGLSAEFIHHAAETRVGVFLTDPAEGNESNRTKTTRVLLVVRSQSGFIPHAPERAPSPG